MVKKISEWSLEELKRRKSLLKTCLISFGILGVLMVVLLIVIKAKLTLYVPVFMLPVTWLPMITSLKAVNDELKVRIPESQPK
ncbi:hypothetical protein [Fluviicola sp.]|uniref:hypothetical protein n=1 Tax=Fluviicola sp. TaxID=1917219 RepID=UPI0031E1320F